MKFNIRKQEKLFHDKKEAKKIMSYDPIVYILGGLLFIFVIWIVARIISGAYFKSKEDFLRKWKK